MKEIIENRIYDTQEARYIGSHCNEYPPGSELYEKEELYQCYGAKRFFPGMYRRRAVWLL